MTSLIRPDPFATDTLFPLIGGPVPIVRGGFPPIDHPEYRAATKMTPQDTTIVFYDPPSDPILAHEAGHVLDARHLAWEPYARVADRIPEYHTRDYFSADPNEYIAEAFARAVLSGRRGFKDSTAVDKRFPGAIELIRWMRTRPPFSSDSVRHLIGGPRKDDRSNDQQE